MVLLVPYWNHHPVAFENITEELARDHTVVRYDDRGTGESTRLGPYNMETGAADLAAVAQAVGGGATVVAIGDSCNRAVRVAAEQPDLVTAVLGLAALPASFDVIQENTDSLISSQSVLDAFAEQLGRDYRGAMRAIVYAANAQMTEEELRERLQSQIDYLPEEAALAKMKAWREDDALEPALQTGDRLWLVLSPEIAGPWFPPMEEGRTLIADLLPEAHVEVVEDGIVSRPDLTAAVVRTITADA